MKCIVMCDDDVFSDLGFINDVLIYKHRNPMHHCSRSDEGGRLFGYIEMHVALGNINIKNGGS
jgi:hypothetical protein